MTGFSRRPIATLICCLFAGVPAARASVEAQAPADAAVRPPMMVAVIEASPLRVDRRFDVLSRMRAARKLAASEKLPGTPLPPKPDDDYPLFLIADQMEGQTDESTLAEGNVELRRSGQLLYADRVRYRPIDDEVEADGNVRLVQDGSEIDAVRMKMRMAEQIGFADQAHYSFEREVRSRLYDKGQTVVSVASVNGANSGAPMMLNVPDIYGLPTAMPPRRRTFGSGEAERIDFEGENRISLSRATYSTCKPDEADWYLRAERMHLDQDANEGTATNASLWFKGAPIFYTPGAWFPLSDDRRSGLLSPTLKHSTKTGLDFSLPFYWNVAPNYDATFYPRYMSRRGAQLGVEARYLDEYQTAEWRVEYMPHDTLFGERRYAYGLKNNVNFGNGFSGSFDWNGVSDDWYWEDMSSRLLQTSQTQLPRRVTLAYAPASWLQTSLQVLRYQTLQPNPDFPIARPYFLEPRINVLGYKANVLGTDFSLIGQYSRFTHEESSIKDVGQRMVLYPQLSLPIVHPAFQLTPKIGLHMTSYAIDRALANGGQSENISRTLPIFTLDSSVVFEREDSFLGAGYIQTLEPRLYYVRIPYRDQSNIPVFDTGLSDFNFAQIFSENRYSGYDRINDANQLTAALTTRILDSETGAERFRAMLGQRYYFDRQRVSLPNETTREENFSNLIASVSGLLAPKTYAEMTWEYNYKDSQNERFSAGVRFQPDYGKVLAASYRYTRDPLTDLATVDQVDVAGQWPLSSRWYAVGRYNYSMRDHQLLEAIGGLEYNAGCWAIRLVGQRLNAVSGTPNDSIYLQLELQDFASIGSNPLKLLRRSVPGYGKINELPDN
ncbi:MAG: LPS assembly protein LptD [Azonexaceae bacterium]|nr:LPS assembly protein LptD [Azonexaceae bacterium]